MKRRFPHQRPKKSPCPASLKVGTRDKEKGHKENSLSLAAWQAFSSCRQCRGLTFKRFAGIVGLPKLVRRGRCLPLSPRGEKSGFFHFCRNYPFAGISQYRRECRSAWRERAAALQVPGSLYFRLFSCLMNPKTCRRPHHGQQFQAHRFPFPSRLPFIPGPFKRGRGCVVHQSCPELPCGRPCGA